MAMKWSDTKHSSNVDAVGFDPDTGEMLVRFRSGATYSWSGISRQQASALAGDRSPGSYLHANFPTGRKA